MKAIEISINKIKCKFYIPAKESSLKEIIIICHGVTTKKYKNIVNQIGTKLIDKNFGIVCFDFIDSSKHKLYNDKFCLYKFITKLELVYSFVKESYKDCKIDMFSSGFGAYVALASINDLKLHFNKIVFNTPAIKMAYIFKKQLAKYDLVDFNKINMKKLSDEERLSVTDLYNELHLKDLLDYSYDLSNTNIIYDNRDINIPFEDIDAFATKSGNCLSIEMANSNEEIIEKVVNSFSNE